MFDFLYTSLLIIFFIITIIFWLGYAARGILVLQAGVEARPQQWKRWV